MRRRGELSAGGVDRAYPFQVAVKCITGQNVGHLNQSGPFSSLCWRRHHVGDDSGSYEVFCFADRTQADQFRDAIRGEDFDPRDWSGGRWIRRRGARRDEVRRSRGYW